MTALADHLTAHALRYDEMSDRTECLCGWYVDNEALDYSGRVDLEIDRIHASHVSATWAEHRTVRTLEDLDALKDGAILLAGVDGLWEVDSDGRFELRGDLYGDLACYAGTFAEDNLPALVLYVPGDDR